MAPSTNRMDGHARMAVNNYTGWEVQMCDKLPSDLLAYGESQICVRLHS
jgi:hypothetical protein